MTTTYKYRAVLYKEVIGTPLRDYAETSRDYGKLKELFPDFRVELEKVKDESKKD